jgi:hypothetical protein
MALFLQILGFLCLAFIVLILLLIVAWQVLKRKLRSALSNLADDLGDMKYTQVPPRLHLKRQERVEWLNPAPVDSLAASIRPLGFQEAGTFLTEEMDYLRLRALVHVEDRTYAVVYEHDKAGVWMDFFSEYEDGRTVTYSTAPQGGEIAHRPTSIKVLDKEADPADLYQRFVTERPEGVLIPVSVDAFPAVFQAGYARDIDWRNSRGGSSEAEIRQSLAASGEEFTEEMVQQVRQQSLYQAVEGLDVALRERLERETQMSIAEWEARRERLVFVFDLLTSELLIQRIQTWQPWTEDAEAKLAERIKGRSPRAEFAAYNDTLPPENRFEKLAELSEPVPADVYVAPLQPEEEDDDEE